MKARIGFKELRKESILKIMLKRKRRFTSKEIAEKLEVTVQTSLTYLRELVSERKIVCKKINKKQKYYRVR